MRVLIIDDDRADREIYKRSLTAASGNGLEFAESESGREGIAKAKRWGPDCVLLDYHLPDMDGLEVLDNLSPQQAPFPVIMLTAFGGEVLAVQAMKAGATDYLPKQHARAEFLSRAVTNAMDRFQMQRQIQGQQLALEQSARRYKDLLEAMPQMVWMADSGGSLEYANRRWLDYTAGGCAADRLDWNELVHPEDQERTWANWRRAVDSGSTFEIEHRLRKAPDGEFRWHLVRAVPMRDDGDAVRWFGTCTETEDQKREEKERLQHQKLESIGRLAGGIAHDFNNLLVSILGGSIMVSEHLPTGNPTQPILRDVISAGERAAQLTRQLLAYAGKANLFVERVDLNQIVSQICDGIRPTLPARTRLEVHTAPNLPPIETDLAQVRQVTTDLVMNAKEAVERAGGVVVVRTGVEEVGPEAAAHNRFGLPEMGTGLYVVLEVQDNGCGMNEETQQKMFDPFFSTKATGRGLGLASVQGFVRTNRGGIEVQSRPSEGTRIRVLLPAAATRAARNGN